MSKLAHIRGADRDFVEEFQQKVEEMAHKCLEVGIHKDQIQGIMQFCRTPFRVPCQNLDHIKQIAVKRPGTWGKIAEELLGVFVEVQEWSKEHELIGEDLFKQAKSHAMFMGMLRDYVDFLEMGDFQNTYVDR